MVKVINACASTAAYWSFSAATDERLYGWRCSTSGGVSKIYFNYPATRPGGQPDTNAFATCP